MRSTALLSTALLLATSAAQYFSYDDFSDDLSLNVRDQQYGLDMDNVLELYSREADPDFEDDLFDFDTRGEATVTTDSGKDKSFSISSNICIVNKKVEQGNKCNGNNVIGTLKVVVKLPPNTTFKAGVSGSTK